MGKEDRLPPWLKKMLLSRRALVIPVVHQTACTIVVGLFVASSRPHIIEAGLGFWRGLRQSV